MFPAFFFLTYFTFVCHATQVFKSVIHPITKFVKYRKHCISVGEAVVALSSIS